MNNVERIRSKGCEEPAQFPSERLLTKGRRTPTWRVRRKLRSGQVRHGNKGWKKKGKLNEGTTTGTGKIGNSRPDATKAIEQASAASSSNAWKETVYKANPRPDTLLRGTQKIIQKWKRRKTLKRILDQGTSVPTDPVGRGLLNELSPNRYPTTVIASKWPGLLCQQRN